MGIFKKVTFLFILCFTLSCFLGINYAAVETADSNNGNWADKTVILKNTSEAALMVRVGDIDNLGFGWPENFDPFSGNKTPIHAYPWTIDKNDPDGTDRIFVISSYKGNPPKGSDGYTNTTARPDNTFKPISLSYKLDDNKSIKSAILQMFVDDFQSALWGSKYETSINGVSTPFLDDAINSLAQTGPVGNIITVNVPESYLYLFEKRDSSQNTNISISIDDTTTGAGDGYAIDFVKVLINYNDAPQVSNKVTLSGKITDSKTGNVISGALISADEGIVSTTSDPTGNYNLSDVPAGIVSLKVSAEGFETKTQSFNAVSGSAITTDFSLLSVPKNSITPSTAEFDSSGVGDITVQIGKDSCKLLAIKNGAASLSNNDYSISGNIVTIKKSYLTYFFTKFNLPGQKLNLLFDFENGNDTTLTITRAVISNFITCDNRVFDLSNPQSITVNITGAAIKAIKIGSASLNNNDYSISGNTVTINKDYLKYFFSKYFSSWSKLNLVFDFEGGNDPLLTVSLMPYTNSITCRNPVFYLSSPQDITISIAGNTLNSIKNGSASLNNNDYSISGNTITIKKSYLSYFFNKFNEPWQKLYLTLDFEKGNDPLLTITQNKTQGTPIFKAITAGGTHTVALKEDGTVVAWGLNTSNQCTVPVGLTGVKAIAAGARHTVALKEDGTVVAWGDNSDGQCEVPRGLSGVKAIAAGHYHTVALKEDGIVVAWGFNYGGQCSVPEGLSGIKDISAEVNSTLALKQDGTVVDWGKHMAPSGLSGIKSISTGFGYAVALKEDGSLITWSCPSCECKIPDGLSNIKAISAGYNHTVALKEDGTVVAWGLNSSGQCTVPAGLTGVIAISAGGGHTIALKKDGTFVAWGANTYGQCTFPGQTK